MERAHYFFYERRRGEPGNRVFSVGQVVGTMETAMTVAKALHRTSWSEQVEAYRGTRKNGEYVGFADDTGFCRKPGDRI